MYKRNNTNPDQQAFSEDTAAVIKQVMVGKLESFWEAESAIATAILNDSKLDASTKATEVQRCMGRYLSLAGLYSNVTEISYMYNPHTPSPYIGELHTDNVTVEVDVNLSENKLSVYKGDIPHSDLNIYGIYDNATEHDIVALIVVADDGIYYDTNYKLAIFNKLMHALGLDSKRYGFTMRKASNVSTATHSVDVLYIDPYTTGDFIEDGLDFSEVVKNNITALLNQYDIFPIND